MNGCPHGEDNSKFGGVPENSWKSVYFIHKVNSICNFGSIHKQHGIYLLENSNSAQNLALASLYTNLNSFLLIYVT